MISLYRPAFEIGLRLVAQAFGIAATRSEVIPLVGGAAVELYTAGAMATHDFDIVTAADEALAFGLRSVGFEKPMGLGDLSRAWVHPDLPLGVELAVFADGRTCRAKAPPDVHA